MSEVFTCPCCGGDKYTFKKVLWPELIKDWHLSKKEAAYTDRQQGLTCKQCGSNLRSMTLAKAIMNCYDEHEINFDDFIKKHKDIGILELNTAGQLTALLSNVSNYTFAEYPEVDIEKLPYSDSSFDMVIHSVTLEHVNNPIKGLGETLRVLKPGGYTCFTTPIITDRLSERRDGKKPSFHGSKGNDDYLVHTEYGSDVWTQVLRAGFNDCRLTTIEYPSSIAITGHKAPLPSRNKWRLLGK